MEGDPRLAVIREQLERTTVLLDSEREALLATRSFADISRVYALLALVEAHSAQLHKRLVAWHSRYPERPALSDTDAFWADMKELRAAKEELATALDAIRAHERQQPTMKTQLERACTEVADVEKYFSSYLDRVNAR